MAIFSSLSTFLRRHRRKLLITTSVSLGVYFLFNHFVIKKFRSFQQSLKQEAFVREQIKRRFTQTQKDCYLTILALLPVLTQPILDHLPVELVTQALKNKKGTSNAPNSIGNSKVLTDSMLTTGNLENLEKSSNIDDDLSFYSTQSKTELWKILKIKTITRFLTLSYTLSGLLLITRLSMNILARRSYLETAIQMAGDLKKSSFFGIVGGGGGNNVEAEESSDYFAEQSFLSLSWWLLNKGWFTLSNNIEDVVNRHFENINARTEISIKEFESILNNVVQELNSPAYEPMIKSSIFPPNNHDALLETLSNTTPEIIQHLYQKDSTLLKLIDETYFFIEDVPSFMSTYYNMVENINLVTLINNLSISLEPELLMKLDNGDEDSKIFEIDQVPEGKRFKLAILLAQLSIQSAVLCDSNNVAAPQSGFDTEEEEFSGNVFINNLDLLEVLDELSASIYSNFQ